MIFTEAQKIFQKITNDKIKNANSLEVKNWYKMKQKHSFHVSEVCNGLADAIKLKFPKKLVENIKIAGLFHDLGRFFQDDGTKILKSKSSIHGELGAIQLQKIGINNPCILLPIKYHNVLSLDSSAFYTEVSKFSKHTQKEILLITNLARDADVLGNWEMFSTDNNLYSLRKKEPYISKKCFNRFLNNELVLNEEKETIFDSALCYICWKFNLNNKISKEYAEKHKLLKKLIDVIELKANEFENNFFLIQQIKTIKEYLL